MKIEVMSDLHMEFRAYEINNIHGADVLVLAGDILVIEDIKRWPMNDSRENHSNSVREFRSELYQEFFDQVSQEYKHVVIVPGNHEYYGSVFQEADDILEGQLAHWKNIHYLNKNAVDLDGVVFVGATLWTDFWKSSSEASNAGLKMNDYRKIRWKNSSYRKLRPSDIVDVNRRHLRFIMDTVDKTEAQGKRCVVVTHHAPSKRSIATEFANSSLNSAYTNQLDDLIQDFVNVPVWIHGHVHQKLDYMIGLTNVVCSPMGYPGELKNPKGKIIEI